MNAEADAAEAAAKAAFQQEAAEAAAEPVATPAPETTKTKEEQPPEPSPEPVKNDETDALKRQLAEIQARNEELTKRVRDEDGRRGGELAELRKQNEGLSNQVRELMTEIREARKAAPAAPVPPEDEPLAKYDQDVKDGVRQIAKAELKPLAEEVERAKAEAKAVRQMSEEMKQEQFRARVELAVPKLSEIINSPKWEEWLKGRNPGNPYTRAQSLDAAASTYNHGIAIELLAQYEAEQNTAAAKPIEPPKGPEKPSKEAQVAVPSTANAVPSKKPNGLTKARMAELDAKLYRFGTATKEDREEYERLCDAEALGQLT